MKYIFKIVMLGLLMAPTVFAEKVRFIELDQQALQVRVDFIQQAKKEILFEYFSVWNDEQSLAAMSLLVQAAQRGVEVKVILDAASSKVPKALFTALLMQGKDTEGKQKLEIRSYNPFHFNFMDIFHRDHAKMLITDGVNLLTGGRNIGDRYFGFGGHRNFTDLDILVNGATASAARANFMEVWNSGLVHDPRSEKYSEDNLAETNCNRKEDQVMCLQQLAKVRMTITSELERIRQSTESVVSENNGSHIRNQTGTDWFVNIEDTQNVFFISQNASELVHSNNGQMNEPIFELLMSAKSDVNIVSPYLILRAEYKAKFQELIDHGVRVRILTNSLFSTDNAEAQAGYRDNRAALIKMGLEIFEYNGPNTIHAKTFIIDHKDLFVGTYNFDPRSAIKNREVGIIIKGNCNDKLSVQLAAIIEVFRSHSTLVGLNGEEKNPEFQLQPIPTQKKVMIKLFEMIMPFIRNQL